MNESVLYQIRTADINRMHTELVNNGSAWPPGDREQEMYESLNPTNNTAYMTASMFRNVTVPFICAFGVIGNVMAVITFMYRRLRHTSFNFYLAVRSVSDTVFLLTLLCVWFDSVGVNFFNTSGLCQIIVFLSYISSFMNVWSVVAITIENYLRICRPTRIYRLCTLLRAKQAVFILLVISTLIYQTSLWTTSVQHMQGQDRCMTSSEFQTVYLVLTYVDTFITLILPLSTIVILTTRTIFSVIKSYRRKLRLRNVNQGTRLNNNNVKFSSTPQAKVTRLLLAVSLTFIFLHTPIHIMNLKMIVDIFILGKSDIQPIDVALKKVFENMYYLNFSVNFIVFFLCGTTFRKSFWKLFCTCLFRSSMPTAFRTVEQQTDLTLLKGKKTVVCQVPQETHSSEESVSLGSCSAPRLYQISSTNTLLST